MKSGQFVYMTELVASGLKREAQVLEIASKLAMIPEIAAGSITSYAGGQLGQDSIRVGTAVRARGLVPNVHLTCVGHDRKSIEKTLDALQALEMHNIFSISGDWPKAAQNTAVFDIDSVQLAQHIADVRARTGTPFFISCAVSPFKYQREDLLYQYLKLEKKIAAGADMAITQVGWDATKFVELKKYLDERGLKTPVLGNVYVLSRRAAERMNTGNPPGCWASDELVAVLRKESEAPDGGLQARLERAARTVAILKGIGYAGAYIGGTHDARHITQIIHRAEELAPRWEELFEELQFGKKDGFYLYKRDPQPKPTRTLLPTVMDAAGKALPFVPVVEERHGLARAARARRRLPVARTASRAQPLVRAVRVPTRRRKSSAARIAATACSGPWSTSVRRPARSRCATARAAAHSTATARSSVRSASG